MSDFVENAINFIKQFPKTNPIVFLVILSNSESVLTYEYTPNEDTCVSSFWLSKDGKTQTSSIENELFGFDLWQNAGRIMLSMKRMKSRVFELVLDSTGNPACIGVLDSKSCRMEYATVEFIDSLPKDISIVGTEMTEDGGRVKESFPVSMFQ